LANGSAPNEVKRSSQIDGDPASFACKWYASAARSLGRQDRIGQEAESIFDAITFSSDNINLRPGFSLRAA
jgi:hypothetical protein